MRNLKVAFSVRREYIFLVLVILAHFLSKWLNTSLTYSRLHGFPAIFTFYIPAIK